MGGPPVSWAEGCTQTTFIEHSLLSQAKQQSRCCDVAYSDSIVTSVSEISCLAMQSFLSSVISSLKKRFLDFIWGAILNL